MIWVTGMDHQGSNNSVLNDLTKSKDVADIFRMIPKAELHGHLSGCIRYTTIQELASQNALKLAPSVMTDLRSSVTLSKPSVTYSGSFLPWKLVIDKITATPQFAYRLAFEVAEDMARDGVVYGELRVPAKLPFDVDSFSIALSETDRALRDAFTKFGIDVRLIIGYERQGYARIGLQKQLQIVESVLGEIEAYKDRRVVGFDLYGVEDGYPPDDFVDLFKIIRANGYRVTIHAGEHGSPENIAQAIESLQAQRIGHATLIVQQPRLFDLMTERDVSIEVCLTSNIMTGVVRDFDTHPLRQMVDQGLKVSLCSDNTLVYNTSLSIEYARAVCSGLLSVESALDMVCHASEISFLPDDERNNLTAQLRLNADFKDLISRRIECLLSS